MEEKLKEQAKAFDKVLKKFDEEMQKKGFYSLFINDNKWRPKIICTKKNHYRFELTCFFEPFSNEKTITSLCATYGTDLSSIMDFSIRGLNNLDERFEIMFNAATPYIDLELPETVQDRREF